MVDKKIRFIISTGSGRGDNYTKLLKQIEEAFAGLAQPDIKLTETADDITEYSQEWAELYGEDGIVYICGGDGATSEAANALYNTDTYLGVIPRGTNNDFAKTLYGKKLNRSNVFEKIIQATPNPRLDKIDLIKVNDHVSINVVSLGYDTVVLEHAYAHLRRMKILYSRAYPLAVLETLFIDKSHPLKYHFIDKEGKTVSGTEDAIISVIANGKYYGSGFNPAPEAEIDDGLGNFLIAGQMPIWKLVPLILKYARGRHIGNPNIHHFEFTKGYIETVDGSNIKGNYDGIIFETNRLEIEMLPKVLNFAYID